MSKENGPLVKKLYRILNILACSLIGAFAGQGLYVFWDYRTRPGLYVMQPVPWYTDMIVNGIFTMILLLMIMIVKIMIKLTVNKKQKKP